jgi:hypothetical protein
LDWGGPARAPQDLGRGGWPGGGRPWRWCAATTACRTVAGRGLRQGVLGTNLHAERLTQLGDVCADAQGGGLVRHRTELPTPLRIGGQSVRCQIDCETCQLH